MFKGIVHISPEVHRTLHLLGLAVGTHSFTVSSPCGDAAHFLQLKPFALYQFFVPPGTHYCWVDRGNVDSKLVHAFFIQVCIQLTLLFITIKFLPNFSI